MHKTSTEYRLEALLKLQRGTDRLCQEVPPQLTSKRHVITVGRERSGNILFLIENLALPWPLEQLVDVRVRVDLQSDPREQHLFPTLVTPSYLRLRVGIVAVVHRIVPYGGDIETRTARSWFLGTEYIK